MFSLEDLFCLVDDFCCAFEPQWQQQLLADRLRHRRRRSLRLSEIMTIVIVFHQWRYRDFKTFYTQHVCVYWRSAFPGLVSYGRFVEWMPSVLLPLCVYLRCRFGDCRRISFIDSTSIKVCHNRRINSHKVFAGIAARGKTSVDWFFGFRLHLVVNDQGELLNFSLSAGNLDDCKPVLDLLHPVVGKVFGDKGYISQSLAEKLLNALGIQLITKLRRNMKNRLMPLADRLLLRKRAIIESVIDQLKNISQSEHSRHRSPVNFLVNLVSGLIAYCHQPKKPSLEIELALPTAT